MKKKFKLLALLLSACILGSGIPGVIPSVPAFAKEEEPVEPVKDYDDSEFEWFNPNSGESASIAADADQRSAETNAAIDEAKTGVTNITVNNAVTDDVLIQEMSRGGNAGIAPVPFDPTQSGLNKNLTVTIDWEGSVSLPGGLPAGSGGYIANRTLAGMGTAVSSLPLAENEAVMSLTVDNFWIAGRSPATEEELKKQPKVILGKNRGTQLYVNGQEATVSTDLAKAKALIAKAEASVKSAEGIREELTNPESIQSLEDTIAQANTFISQAKAATDEQLLDIVTNQGYDYLNSLAGMPSSLAYSFLIQEQGGLDAGSLSETLGISENDLTTFAARSGFTLENLIAFFTEKRMTLQDFSTMLTGITDMGYTIKDFIEAGVLDNEGVGGLVVRLEDSAEGIQAVFTAPSGVTYHFCGAVILNNGMQIQLGDPCNKEDPSQKFGEVKMDAQGTTCFFSTVYSKALGLFPGEMLISRYMVIQDAKGNPILYWFDETGSRTELGPLNDLDPDGTIAKIFNEACYKNGLPLETDGDSFPEGFDYLAHDFEYIVQQAPTCLRMGIERIKCKNCGFELAKNLPTTSHYLKKTEKKEATCTEEGTEAYWTCSFCNRRFSDNRGTTVIQEPAVIARTAHSLIPHAKAYASCTVFGRTAYWECRVCRKLFSDEWAKNEITLADTVIKAGHTLTPTAAKEATCTEPGNSAYWTCSVCKKLFSDEEGKTEIALEDTVIKAAGHTLTPTAAKEASCTEPGNSAYWTCDVCEKLFSDEEGKTEITLADTVIKAGHTLTPTAAKEATCTEPGNSAYWECSVCKKLFSDKEGKTEIALADTIIEAGHKLTATAAKEASCTEPGNSAYWTCDVCEKLFSDEEGKTEITLADTVIKAGHKLTATAAKEATCTEPGNSAYWECSVCKKLFSDKEGKTEIDLADTIIEAGHKLTATAAKEATCTESGNIAYWTCDVCGKLFSDKEGKTEIALADTVIKAAGHTLTPTAAKEATCTEPGNSAYWTCDVCEKLFSDEQGKTEIALADTVIKAAGHKLTATAAKEASCTEPGNSAYWTCDVCGKLFSDEQGKTEIAQADTVIEAGHKLVKTEAVEPTTEQAGRHEYWTCSVCGKYFSDADGENEIAENSWILKLKTTIQAPGLSIPAQPDLTVAAVIRLLFDDAVLLCNGEVVEKSDTNALSIISCSADLNAWAVNAAGTPFTVTVRIEPADPDIYEAATESFANVEITPQEFTPLD